MKPLVLAQNSVSVVIAGILGFVARHFADLSSASTSNSTDLISDGNSQKILS
jgi:hypothetical protein